jgi:hypothetical protein
MIPPPVREQMNELSARLGYPPVDDGWGTGAAPDDLRLPASRRPAGIAAVAAPVPAAAKAADAAIVGERLRAGLALIDEPFTRRWGPCSAETFSLIAIPPAGTGQAGDTRWRVDLAARAVAGSVAVPAGPGAAGEAGRDDTAWDMVGSVEAWRAVLSGRTNLGVAIRRCELRYCDTGEEGPVVSDHRVAMLADLLGLKSSWQPAR